jgi:hypothetical protein
MRIFGCPDCANADGKAKTQAMSTKGRRNLLKICSPFEQKSDCAGAVIATVLATQVSASRVDIAE